MNHGSMCCPGAYASLHQNPLYSIFISTTYTIYDDGSHDPRFVFYRVFVVCITRYRDLSYFTCSKSVWSHDVAAAQEYLDPSGRYKIER